MEKIKFLLTIILLVFMSTVTPYPPTCDMDIFCKGDILHTVQVAQLFDDSKTFVDMKLKKSADEIQSKFKSMMDKSNNKPKKAEVKRFVDECFGPPGSEFTKFLPKDWKKNPKFLDKIDDDRFKEWGKYLHSLWKSLGRKMISQIKTHKDRYSIMYVPNPVIVPGGRFREFYYWDSYWIVLGLLHSEMKETVKGMLENFIQIIKDYGLIPNGGRIYYVRRSQPPLMVPMVKLYYDYTQDKAFIAANIDTLAKEFDFWMKKRCVDVTSNGKTVKLAHYSVETAGPRPESYREDIETARNIKTDKGKDEFYAELKSACESGWDFSSRWFINRGTNKGNLTNIKTRSIIPVDLNAIICWNAKLLAYFYKLLGNSGKQNEYNNIAKEWQGSIQSVLWDDKGGIWYDYDIVGKQKRKYYYASNFAPLWTGCYDKSRTSNIAGKVLKYIEKIDLKQYEGGIPTSLEHTGEQWDFPNAWPPLQHIIIEGLENANTKETKALAYHLAFNWIRANFKGYLTTQGMFEKYDAQTVGAYGGGGEYAVQLGFGWTNGICLDLLTKYGSKLDSTGISGADRKPHNPTAWLMLIITLLSRF